MYSNFSNMKEYKKTTSTSDIYFRTMENINHDNREKMYNKLVDRKIFERGINFNNNTRKNEDFFKKNNSNKLPNDPNVGEITGQILNVSEIDQGMPLRFDIVPQIPMNINYDTKYNPRLDFDLYDSKPNINVSYFDPILPEKDCRFSQINNNEKIYTENFSHVINDITFALYEQLGKHASVASPFSVIELLNILYSASTGSTEKELHKFFLSYTKSSVIQSVKKTNKQINSSKSCKSKNMILCAQYIHLSKAFINHIDNLATFNIVNINQPKSEAQKINYYISQQTNGLITDIIEPNDINKYTSIILINTIYFYSKWKTSFNIKDTKNELFYGYKTKNVLMMTLFNTSHNYMENDFCQLLEMKYIDPAFVFGIMLPKNNNYPTMNQEMLLEYISNLTECEINILKVPKFKQKSKHDIIEPLKKLNLVKIFTSANLDNMTTNDTKINVSSIKQHATIIVNETGTKATACTVSNVSYGYTQTTQRNINFIANHPFMYYIRHIPSNCLIFVGKYI